MPMPTTTTTPTEKPTSTPIPYIPTGTMSQRITKRQTSRQSGKGKERDVGRRADKGTEGEGRGYRSGTAAGATGIRGRSGVAAENECLIN